MKDEQTRKLNAAETGLEVIDQNNAVWSASTAFSDQRDALEAKIDTIESTAASQEADITGHATGKSQIKLSLIEQALKICKPMTAYARIINNETLRAEVDYEKTDFTKVSEAVLQNRTEVVHARANTHLSAMVAGGYPIDAPAVTLLGNLVMSFDDKQGTPKAARDAREAVTADLDRKFDELDGIQTLLKELAVGFGSTFAEAVKQGFQIDNTGRRKLSLEFRILDSIALVQLRNATVKILENGLTKKSSKVGRVGFLSLANGNYTIKITLAGYTEQTLANVGVSAGTITRLEVRLVKI